MVEPINLRQFRKRKEREEKEAKADENRKVFGISTHEKKAIRAQLTADIKKLDQLKIDKPDN